jgi:hypothetical protein
MIDAVRAGVKHVAPGPQLPQCRLGVLIGGELQPVERRRIAAIADEELARYRVGFGGRNGPAVTSTRSEGGREKQSGKQEWAESGHGEAGIE